MLSHNYYYCKHYYRDLETTLIHLLTILTEQRCGFASKWVVSCTDPANTSFHVLSSNFTRAIYGQELLYMDRGCPVFIFHSWQSPKVSPCPFGWQIIFYPITFSPTRCRKPLAVLLPFPWKIFKWMTLIIPPVVTYAAKSRHAMHILENHPHFLRILFVRCKCHTSCFFPRTTAMWNRLPRGCFIDHDNLNLFKSMLSCYLPGILT